MYMNQEILTEEEINLIKEMETPSNNDGFYEMLFQFSEEDDNEFSFEKLLFEVLGVDENIPQILKALYDEYGEKQFVQRISYLAQISIRNRVLTGKVTDEYISNVVAISDISWMKEELKKNSQSKDLKVIYFLRRFQDAFLYADYILVAKTKTIPSPEQRGKLRREYIRQAKKISKYLLDLFKTDDDMFISGEIAERILKELKGSF